MEIDFFDFLLGLRGFSTGLNIFFALLLCIYLIFAFLVYRQVHSLNKSFATTAERLLNAFALLHFVATLVLLLFALGAIL